MPINRLLGISGACLVLGLAVGWALGARHAQTQLSQARVDAALWRSRADAGDQALASVRGLLEQQRNQYAQVEAIVQTAVQDRDTLHQQYDTLRAQRQAANETAAHDDPQCVDLDRPLCPTVARRLFGGEAQAAPAADGD